MEEPVYQIDRFTIRLSEWLVTRGLGISKLSVFTLDFISSLTFYLKQMSFQDSLVPFEICVIFLWTTKACSDKGINNQIRDIIN